MANKDIEIPFGAYDSELGGFEYTIPEGYKAEIKDGKVVVKKTESEDEKMMRKFLALIEWSKSYAASGITTDEAKEMLAWLEKQDEHANFCNKIQVGDKVTRNEDGVLVNLSQLNRVAKKDEKQGKNNMGISETTKQKLEDNLNKALEKETPESLNKFIDEHGSQILANPAKTCKDEQKPAEWHREDEQNLNACLGYIPDEFLRRWLTDAIHAIYDNHTWSEEDETVLNNLIYVLANDRIGNDRDEYISYLKSLKDRYTWKPSDKQMKRLKGTINSLPHQEVLYSLYQDLKKLREDKL